MNYTNLSLQSFMIDFELNTTTHPISNFLRIWNNNVAFEVKVWGDEIRLSSIKSFSKNNGNGTAALKWITALAEKHGVCISGDISPIKEKEALNKYQLKSWYSKNGFLVKGDKIFYNYNLKLKNTKIKLIL